MSHPTPTRAISVRVFQTLLLLYPAEFRRRFAAEMIQVFEDMLQRTPSKRLYRLWLRVLSDILLTAFQQHTSPGIQFAECLTGQLQDRVINGDHRRTFKQLLACAMIGLSLAVPLRLAVAAPYRTSDNSLAPEIPKGTYVLVYKLARDFQPGDFVVYRAPEGDVAAKIAGVDRAAESLHVTRLNGSADEVISSDQLIGRILLRGNPTPHVGQ